MPVPSVAPLACAPDAAAGAGAPAGSVALLPSGAAGCAADCAIAGADMASTAAIMHDAHDAHDAENTPLETNPDLNTDRDADMSVLSGERAKSGDKFGNKRGGSCDKRET